MRSGAARDAVFGLIAGAWLSLARLPHGGDWLAIPAADERWRTLARLAALLVIGAALIASHATAQQRAGRMLWSACAGFVLHGFLAADALLLAGPVAFVLAAIVALLALHVASRDAASGDELATPRVGELIGLAAGGAGVSLALHQVSDTLRMTSNGLPADDTAMAGVFLALLACGAGAFGPLFASSRHSRIALPIALAAAGAGAWDACRALAALSERAGLVQLLERAPWNLDVTRVGRLDGDAVIAARVLVVPALALGLALACARDRKRLGALAIGAAFAIPSLRERIAGAEPELATARAVVLGAVLAAAGAALFAATTAELTRTARLLIVAVCAGLALAVANAPRVAALPLTPAAGVEHVTQWRANTPHGLATVERMRGAERMATLDRRQLVPLDDELEADAERFRAAGPAQRVLLVGQLTPARARALRELGAERVDRTAVWSDAMAAMERELYAGEPIALAGDVLAPHEARERAENGAYDLICVPPTSGAAPVIDPPRLSSSTRFVAWLDGRSDAVSRAWGERVLLASDGGASLSIGVVDDPAKFEATFDAGSRSCRSPTLAGAPWQREFANQTRTAERIARAARSTPNEKLASGLALHFAAQVASSPYESPLQRVELDAAALDLLRDAALAREPDRFVRALWNGLARTLVEKRDPELVERDVAPLAERWKPWPELELALAITDLELLDPEAALARLARATEAQPSNGEILALFARTQLFVGLIADAVKSFERASAAAPGNRTLRRELAMARVRAGDLDARAEVARLVAEEPDDEELARFLEDGPWPPPPSPLRAASRHEH